MRMIFTKLYVIILLGYIDPRESVLHVDQMMSIYDRIIKPRFFLDQFGHILITLISFVSQLRIWSLKTEFKQYATYIAYH